MKALVTSAALALAFLVNCEYLAEPEWQYGEAELRASIEGTWKLTLDGRPTQLRVRQAAEPEHRVPAVGFVKQASACASRSFVRSAAACVTQTAMPLEITADHHVVADARLVVYGTTFERAGLWMAFDGHRIEALVDRQGHVASISTALANRVTLERIAR